MVSIEINPRINRSPALDLLAAGFPISKSAAKFAVACLLDEFNFETTKNSFGRVEGCRRGD